MFEAVTKAVLAALALAIGGGLIAWIAYNELVDRLPGYERPPLAGPLGLGPLVILVGAYWARQSLRFFAGRRRGAGEVRRADRPTEPR